jgi:hypothetical protein
MYIRRENLEWFKRHGRICPQGNAPIRVDHGLRQVDDPGALETDDQSSGTVSVTCISCPHCRNLTPPAEEIVPVADLVQIDGLSA